MNPDILNILLSIIGIVAVLEIGVHVFSIWVIVPIFERKLPFEGTPAEPNSEAERLSIPTVDGLALRGSLYLPEEDPLGLVIFCPEFRGTQWSALDYCQGLRDAGFAILSFDFRGQGESDAMPGYQPLHWCSDFEVRDVESVIRFAQEHAVLGQLPIGLFGVSRGANAALAAGAADRSVECVVSDSGFTTDTLMVLYAARWVQYYAPRWFRLPEWHLYISCRLARFVSEFRRKVRHPSLGRLLPALRRRNVLLIAGKRDTYVPCESSIRIRKRIGGDSTVWLVPRARHNLARQTNPQEYDKRIVDLFLNMVPIHQLPSVTAPEPASVEHTTMPRVPLT